MYQKKVSKENTTKKRGTGSARIYEVLRGEILSMSLKPTDRLDEAGLSKRFSCSRTPVREALLKLASEDLVVTLPNRSAIVTPLDLLTIPPYFDAFTLLQRVTTRLAAQFRNDSDLINIRRNQASFDAALEAGDAVEMNQANREFHVSIAEAGRNPYYTGFYTRLLDEGMRLQHAYFSSDGRREEFSEQHHGIVDAIHERDESLADRFGL